MLLYIKVGPTISSQISPNIQQKSFYYKILEERDKISFLEITLIVQIKYVRTLEIPISSYFLFQK